MKFLPSFLIRNSSIPKKEEVFFPKFFIFFTELQGITSQITFNFFLWVCPLWRLVHRSPWKALQWKSLKKSSTLYGTPSFLLPSRKSASDCFYKSSSVSPGQYFTSFSLKIHFINIVPCGQINQIWESTCLECHPRNSENFVFITLIITLIYFGNGHPLNSVLLGS
jgi:hypothetical protein